MEFTAYGNTYYLDALKDQLFDAYKEIVMVKCLEEWKYISLPDNHILAVQIESFTCDDGTINIWGHEINRKTLKPILGDPLFGVEAETFFQDFFIKSEKCANI